MDLKHKIPFYKRLFIYMMSLFILFLICFLGFQYNREKSYKIEQLDGNLQLFNLHIADLLKDKHYNYRDLDSIISCFSATYPEVNLREARISIIDTSGWVIYDSNNKFGSLQFSNHANRPEVVRALANGYGRSIRRISESTSEEYFYSATFINGIIIRSALEYTLSLNEILSADNKFLWFMLILAIIFSGTTYFITRRLGHNIHKLKEFAYKAEMCEPVTNIGNFPNDELGDISNHIVRLYTTIRQTKEALENEHLIVIEQAKDKIRLKKQLTQNINNELKTPVSSIQGYLEILINNPELSQEQKESFVQKCYTQSNRLTSLLCDISTVTRMEEGSDKIEKYNIDLINIIHNVYDDSDKDLNSHNIKVEFIMPQRLSIFGNPSLLYSIFKNLLDNAIAYSGCNIIYLNVKHESTTKIAIEFSDNGIGVSPEHLPHIFERFYRVDNGRSRKIGGTGLGLSIVKNAVLLHGGNIIAKNQDNGGLQFIFTLEIA